MSETKNETEQDEAMPLSDLLNSPVDASHSFEVIEEDRGKPKDKRKPRPTLTIPWYLVPLVGIGLVVFVIGLVVWVAAPAREVQVVVTATVPYSVTPTMSFRYAAGSDSYDLITLEKVASIDANTEVRLSHAWFDDLGWNYAIIAPDEVSIAYARADQLAYAPDFQANPPENLPYMHEVDVGGYLLTTFVPIGNIPKGSRVNIVDVKFLDGEWVYEIVSNRGDRAMAAYWQLTYAPEVTSRAPTPTPEFFQFQGTDNLRVVTRENIGKISAGTPVYIIQSWLDANGWRYRIVASDSTNFYDAYEWQLELIAETPTPSDS